ncbi:MAG: hypothetical protein QGG58_05480 [Chloroflexota bacterium]|nr:hypothetical protein [Chloroflexota bacterium]
MAELEVGDNLLEGEAGLRDAPVATDREPLVDPIVVTATARNCPSGSQLDLELPAGMYLAEGQRPDRAALDGTPTSWEVRLDPRAAPERLNYRVRLLGPTGPLASTRRMVVTTVHGATGFDPARDGFSFSNSTEVFGTIRPPRPVFARSFAGGWRGPLAERLFHRTYASIFGAGLCTGMAMAALQLFAQDEPPAAERGALDTETRVLIQTLHGRQLGDAALTRAGLDLLRNSPRRVFDALRRATLDPGRQPLALHVGVPVLWRRDFLSAVVGQGHTVVPHTYRITPDGIAEVAVYDPAFPVGEGRPAPPPLRIDLASDSYSYRHWSSGDPDNRTTITRAMLGAYAGRRARVLAGIGSLVM